MILKSQILFHDFEINTFFKVTACGPIDQTGDIKLKMDWSVPTRNIVNREIGEYFNSLFLY